MPLDAWLRGPIDNVDQVLMPAAHALIQASEDLERAAAGLSTAQVWLRPGGAASIGFHLKHIAGSTDRLITYARGVVLDDRQKAALESEGDPGTPPAEVAELIAAAQASLTRALEFLRTLDEPAWFESRTIGRKALPTNVLGLVFHAAEHAQRHTGQIITTAKVVRAT